jgi:hypothetical protein
VRAASSRMSATRRCSRDVRARCSPWEPAGSPSRLTGEIRSCLAACRVLSSCGLMRPGSAASPGTGSRRAPLGRAAMRQPLPPRAVGFREPVAPPAGRAQQARPVLPGEGLALI